MDVPSVVKLVTVRLCRQPEERTFPPLEIRDAGAAGLGIFAATDISAGEWVTEFGGRVVQDPGALSSQSHVLALALGDSSITIRLDGRAVPESPIWSLAGYASRHEVGSFSNSARESNAELVLTEAYFEDPLNTWRLRNKVRQVYRPRAFLRATRAISASEEIVWNYIVR